MTDVVFAKLEPEGSNHALVLQNYLACAAITGKRLLYPEFDTALVACALGRSNRLLICAAHASSVHVVGMAQNQLGMKITDVFLSESQPIAILHCTRRPQTIALHPATRDYADLNIYAEVVEVTSTVAAAEGLIPGRWDAAPTAVRFAGDGMTVAQHFSPLRDAWFVLSGEDWSPVWRLTVFGLDDDKTLAHSNPLTSTILGRDDHENHNSLPLRHPGVDRRFGDGRRADHL